MPYSSKVTIESSDDSPSAAALACRARQATARVASSLNEFAAEFDAIRSTTVQDVTLLRLMVNTHHPGLSRRITAAHEQLGAALVELATVARITADKVTR